MLQTGILTYPNVIIITAKITAKISVNNNKSSPIFILIFHSIQDFSLLFSVILQSDGKKAHIRKITHIRESCKERITKTPESLTPITPLTIIAVIRINNEQIAIIFQFCHLAFHTCSSFNFRFSLFLRLFIKNPA